MVFFLWFRIPITCENVIIVFKKKKGERERKIRDEWLERQQEWVTGDINLNHKPEESKIELFH